MSLVLPVRWGARVLGALIVVFFGFFLIAHLVGDQGQPSRPLMWNDYVILTSIVISLAGLLLAWKWELAGAAITLIAIAVCASVNWNILVSPGALIPLTAAFFLSCRWFHTRQA